MRGKDSFLIPSSTVMLSLTAVAIILVVSMSYYADFFLTQSFCLMMSDTIVIFCIVYCARNILERYVMLCFNITFFIFLLSGMTVTVIYNGKLSEYLDCNERAVNHTCHCLLISIVIVNIVLYNLTNTQKLQSKNYISFQDNLPKVHPLKNVITLIFAVALIGKFCGALIQYMFTQTFDYIETYIVTVNKPTIISIMESIFYLMLCLWLVTLPSKREFIALGSAVLVLEAVILFSGDRGEPMAALLMILYYIYWRGKRDESFFEIKKKHWIFIIVLIPMMIYILQLVSFTRTHDMMTVTDNIFVDFLSEQGISVQIIGKGYELKEKIAEIGGNSFTFGAIRGYLTQNAVSRRIFGIERIISNSVEAATSGDSYGSTMAYIRFRASFLNGIGCGSSYIAELFHDGGWIYLCFGNIILALILKKISSLMLKGGNMYSQALAFLMFYNIVTIPRTNSTGWLTNVFSIQNIMVLTVLLVLQYFVENRRKDENRNAYDSYGR